MRRKVIQQGAATLIVSLPAKWCRDNGVKKGIEIEIQENKDRLIVLPTGPSKTSRVEADITDLEADVLQILASFDDSHSKKSYQNPKTYELTRSAMLRYLTALYKAGYDEIKINYKNPDVIPFIQDSIGQEISEYEIVEQTKHYCVLQDISGVLKERFEPAVRRIFYLLLQMAEESLPLIEKKDYSKLKQLRFLEESNNRFTTYCRRLLSKKGYKNPDKIQFIYLILDRLEILADQYKYLFDYLMNSKFKVSKGVLTEYKRLNELLREYFEFYSTFNKKSMIKIGALRQKIVDNSTSLFDSVSNKECMVLHYILTITQLVFEVVEPTIALEE